RGGAAASRTVDRERGRGVEEALALEDADYPAWNGETLGDRRRGQGVGRRDDRPERDRERPRHARHEGHRGGGDNPGARGDEADGEGRDVLQIGLEVSDRSKERAHIQERRQHDEKDDLWIEL